MNWDILMEVWDSFLSFMDRVVQWLTFLFADGEWPPKDYPNFDDKKDE